MPLLPAHPTPTHPTCHPPQRFPWKRLLSLQDADITAQPLLEVPPSQSWEARRGPLRALPRCGGLPRRRVKWLPSEELSAGGKVPGPQGAQSHAPCTRPVLAPAGHCTPSGDLPGWCDE